MKPLAIFLILGIFIPSICGYTAIVQLDEYNFYLYTPIESEVDFSNPICSKIGWTEFQFMEGVNYTTYQCQVKDGQVTIRSEKTNYPLAIAQVNYSGLRIDAFDYIPDTMYLFLDQTYFVKVMVYNPSAYGGPVLTLTPTSIGIPTPNTTSVTLSSMYEIYFNQ